MWLLGGPGLGMDPFLGGASGGEFRRGESMEEL